MAAAPGSTTLRPWPDHRPSIDWGTLEMTSTSTPIVVPKPGASAWDRIRAKWGTRELRLANAFVDAMLGVAFATAMTAAMLGASVPFILALAPVPIVIAIAWLEGGGAVRRLLHTLTVRPADRRWYLVLAIPALGTLATVGIAAALGAPVENTLERTLPALLLLPLVVAIPAFAEELAWRGYLVPRLLPVMSPLAASLLIAVPWSIVHLVLALPGQMYDGIAIWPSVVTVFSLSVLGTWIFLGTGGSVLMAGLFHALYNASTAITWGLDPETAWALRPLVFAAIALVVVAFGGLRATSAHAASSGAASGGPA